MEWRWSGVDVKTSAGGVGGMNDSVMEMELS
jgi:hypothetical protein